MRATFLTRLRISSELRFHNFGFNVGGPGLVAAEQIARPSSFTTWSGGALSRVACSPRRCLASMYPNGNGDVVLPSTIANGNPLSVVVPANIASLDAGCSAAVQASLVAGQPFP